MATSITKVYNRFPYEFEGQSDSRPFKLPAHSESIVTLDMAVMAIKQSVYKWYADGSYATGVVPQGDPDWGNDLAEEDLKTGDPIKDYEFDLSEPGVTYTPIKVSQPDLRVGGRRRPTDIKVGGGI